MTKELPVRVFRESSTAPGRRLRVAIVGSGMIAAVHRRAIVLAGGELVGVLGSRPERSEQAARRWGLPAAFTDLADLAGSPVDVVHVCSPNVTHARDAEALLAAGKHIVCEKPLGISLAEAEWMNAAAEQAGVVATVPFVYRYHPVVREIRARAGGGVWPLESAARSLSPGLAALAGRVQLAGRSGPGGCVARVRGHRVALVRPG